MSEGKVKAEGGNKGEKWSIKVCVEGHDPLQMLVVRAHACVRACLRTCVCMWALGEAASTRRRPLLAGSAQGRKAPPWCWCWCCRRGRGRPDNTQHVVNGYRPRNSPVDRGLVRSCAHGVEATAARCAPKTDQPTHSPRPMTHNFIPKTHTQMPTTKTSKLIKAFCDRNGLQPNLVRFLNEQGGRVDPEKTVEENELEDGACLITCVVCRFGSVRFRPHWGVGGAGCWTDDFEIDVLPMYR